MLIIDDRHFVDGCHDCITASRKRVDGSLCRADNDSGNVFAARQKLSILNLIVLTVILTASIAFAQFPETRQLTSNNIIALAGSGDTLWIATERGFNYRTRISQDGWFGFEANDMMYRLWSLAFGGGGAAALVNNASPAAADYIGFWHFDHAANRQRERYFRFSNIRDENGDPPEPTGGVVYSNGGFWAPFGEGGLVRYDPSANNVSAIRPGDANATPTQSLSAMADEDKDTKTVLAVTVYGKDTLLVTAPSALWLYVLADNSWEELRTKSDDLYDGGQLTSFGAAFTLDRGEERALLSLIKVNDDSTSRLYRFDFGANRWYQQLDRSPSGIYPAVNGAFYSLLDNNRGVAVNAVSANATGGVTEITRAEDFRRMLAVAGDNPSPQVNDILFIPRADDSGIGTLVVAAVSGLYICENADPFSGEYDFTLIREVRAVGRGQAYALPGIIRSSTMGDGRYDKSVFVYRLRKDGNVTIRVYDYNMSLVKTVVRGERRSAAAERSTDPDRDFWDGTNNLGRRVWPGVYYFKITSTGGDRFLGKVILAK